MLRNQINLNRPLIRNEFLRVTGPLKKFSHIDVWHGGVSTGPTHMAMDEAMLLCADRPVLRWYRWERPEISFGYPMRWRDVEPIAADRPAVRRWTGGGIVEHGSDLTLAIAVPATDSASAEAPLAFYERVHLAIAAALGQSLHLATPADCTVGAACFENPARFDVLHGHRKVVGGAIRRSREGTLYQASIQTVDIPQDFMPRLAENLAAESNEWSPPAEFQKLVEKLVATRYGTAVWLTKR
jgi:lipoate-protein ligase A